MLKRYIFMLTLVGVVGSTLGTGEVAAQCQIRDEIERGARLIERAQEIVKHSGVAEARDLLESAQRQLREADALSQRGDRDRACRLVKVSQALARKAIEIAERSGRGLEGLEQVLQKTDEFLRDSVESVEQGGVDRAMKLLATAFKQQEEAWRAFRSQRSRLALKLTRMAREAGERARRSSRGSSLDGRVDHDRLRRELQQTDELLTRAKESDRAADGGERFQKLLTEATRMQDRAWSQFRAEQFREALSMTRQARTLVARALGQVDVRPEAGRVANMIASTDETVRNLREAAEEANHRKAKQLLDRADKLLDDARRAVTAGRLRVALGSVRAASALALDVSEMLENSGDQ